MGLKGPSKPIKMKPNRIINILVSAASLGCVCACSGSGSVGEGGAEQPLTPEQQKEAVDKARVAARALVDISVDDTLGMQNGLLKARAIQSDYMTSGHKAQAEVFDTAFIHTLRAVRPDIAREVEPNYR